MGKISKLMKLLCASAIVAGANSVALADCGLCGDHEHEVGTCPHFDYRSYGLSKGYTPSKLPENDFLGKLALTDRKNADEFLKIVPASALTSSTISFATLSGDTAGSDTGVATSYDNTWSNTEAASQSSNEKPSASDKLNALKFERMQDLGDSATMVSESDATGMQATLEEMKREETARNTEADRRIKVHVDRMADREEKEVDGQLAEETRAEDLQNLFNEEKARKEEARLARQRDTRELESMVRERAAGHKHTDRPLAILTYKKGVADLEEELQQRGAEEARLTAHENRKKINISDEKKEEILSANDLKDYERREEKRLHKRDFNAEIARLNEKTARQRDTQELKDMMRERVAEDLGKSDAVKPKKDVRDLDLRHRGSEEARDVAYDNRANINISDWEKLRIMGKNLSEADERREARVARKRQEAKARDSKELQSMMANYRDHDRLSNELEAADLRLKRHNIESERALRKELAQQQKAQQSDGASELRNINEAANKIQRARRAQLARRKAKGLAEEQVKREAAAKKITDALRANKERKEAQRQAQIDSNYELTKKLQAEEVNAQIQSDEELAKQLQAEEIAAQMESDHRAAEQLQEQFDEERRVAAMPRQQEENYQRAVGDSEAVETDAWRLPEATKFQLKGFRFDAKNYQMQAKGWARQLENLSIRKVECILWLVSTSYRNLLRNGVDTGDASIYEAVCNVDDIFPEAAPKADVGPAIMNVYNAFENTTPADFKRDLDWLGADELNGILYYVGLRYMNLLSDGKKAADEKFIELAKSAVEHFGTQWEAEDAQVFGEEDETPETDNTGPEIVTGNRLEPQASVTTGAQGIVETEAPETKIWNPPFDVYNAYCGYRGDSSKAWNDSLKTYGIRRLEAIIYLVSYSYHGKLLAGEKASNNAFTKGTEGVLNVFPPVSNEIQTNPRLKNVNDALGNISDRVNSWDGFTFGLTKLTAKKLEDILGVLACTYREKLREGKRPASMKFVELADGICKACSLDGFFYREDEDHPALKFEEFENATQNPTVSGTANANNSPAITENGMKPADIGAPRESEWVLAWELPKGVYEALEFQYERYDADGNSVGNYYDQTDGDTKNEGWARERLGKEIEKLSVRQLEALLGVTLKIFVEKFRISGTQSSFQHCRPAVQRASDVWNLILNANHENNERLLDVQKALQKATNRGSFERDVSRLSMRQLEAFVSMIALVYDDKLDEGAEPADKSFRKFSHDLCRFMFLKYEDDTPDRLFEYDATNEVRRGVLDDGDRALVPVEA